MGSENLGLQASYDYPFRFRFNVFLPSSVFSSLPFLSLPLCLCGAPDRLNKLKKPSLKIKNREMMAAAARLRRASVLDFRNISGSSTSASGAQLLFSRGIASKLFVKGISFSTTEESLTEAFSKFGKVVEAKIIMDKTRDRPKGYAYVTFSMEDEAQKALIHMNGERVDGRVVFVDNARPRHWIYKVG